MHVECHTQAPAHWDGFLEKNEGTYHQSTHNVGYLEPLGFDPLFFSARDDGKTVGQLLAFCSHPLQAVSLGTPLESFAPVAKRMAPVIQAMFGPVTPNDEAWAALVSALKKKADALGAAAYAKPRPDRDRPSFFLACGFQPRACATFIVDLTVPETELEARVKSSARRKIRATLDQGVDAYPTQNERDVAAYFDVVNENRRRNGIAPYSDKSNWGMWRSFQKSGGQLLVAEKSGTILGGIMISTFGGYINEWAPSISLHAMQNKWYVGDVLHWRVMQWGHQNGCTHYDLTGVSPNPANAKEKGIFEFKSKWGGQRVDSNEYHVAGRTVSHRIGQLVKKIRGAARGSARP